MNAAQTYLENLKARGTATSKSFPSLGDLTPWSETNSKTVRAAYWRRDEENPIQRAWTADSILAQCQDDVATQTPSIVLIENIPPELIGMLGAAFGVHERYWLAYLCNPEGSSAWEALFQGTSALNIDRIAKQAGWRPDFAPLQSSQRGDARTSMEYTGQFATMPAFAQCYQCVTPLHYPRLPHFDPQYGSSVSTNLTYFVLADTVCLFLVDAIWGSHSTRMPWRDPQWPVLRIPCAESWDGLIIPDIRSNDQHFSSAWGIFASFCSPVPHRQALLSSSTPRRVMDPITLGYYVSASRHRCNLSILEFQIRDIAFKQLTSDDENALEYLNQTLHQQREEFAVLQSHVQYTKKSMHPEVRKHLARLPTELAGDAPLPTFDEIQKDAVELHRFLMDTFQLLTSTINIRDAKLSIEQSKRTTTLTQLAAVYLPLTLVTGIFGMNVREITRDDPSWWTCVVTLACVVVLTTSLLWTQKAWKRYGSGVMHDVKRWVSLHHCGKRVWKWIHGKWYEFWKR